MTNTLKKIRTICTLALPILLIVSCSKSDLKHDDLTVFSEANANSGKAEREKADVAHDWYKLQISILLERNNALNGLHYAYIGVGLYEAVRPGIRGGQSFYGKIRTMPMMPEPENNQGYNYVICANAALADMTRSFFGGLTDANKKAIDDLEAKYNMQESPDMNSAVFRRSQAYGRSIAAAVQNWFKTDDLNSSNAGYVPPVGTGLWMPTPPAFVPIPVNPYWGSATTFYAGAANTVSPPFPFAYSEDPGSDFYKAVKEVYDASKILTQDQKNTALFWVDQGNGIGLTPAGHDFNILAQCMEQKGVTLDVAAEAYAKAGIAERDGGIVVFRSKYVYNMVRPISYIRKLMEANWNAFIPTPPHPEYPAAHSGVTGSALQAAARVLGEDVPVTDRSYEFRGYPVKTFPSLLDAAKDAGISRLYGGIHYTVSINEGINLAKNIGTQIGDIKLRD
ncbi:MAG TPA: vanadium-dependent haloperoxidase [Chitinophagaceae bacterium]|nr:vanadium-dependent haloperoxidase [Chitinophagaceae bacterium]